LATIASSDRVGREIFMPTRNVNLTEHFDSFIDAGISSGRFSNASEVVREGLRLLEQREQEDKAKLEWLRGAAKEGFDATEQGDYVTLRSDRDIEEFMRQVGEEASVEVSAGSSWLSCHCGRFALPDPQGVMRQLSWQGAARSSARPPPVAMPPSWHKPFVTLVMILNALDRRSGRTWRLKGPAHIIFGSAGTE
jgi:antitoxin ParD1/3/4